MNRNNYHLFSAIATSTLTFLSLMIFGFYLGRDIEAFSNYLGAWLPFIIINFLTCITLGVLQLLNEDNKDVKYAGWLTIFCSIFVFPLIVSLVMYFRSGLTVKQQKEGIRKWVIENFKLFEKAIKAEKVEFTPEVKAKLATVSKLFKEKRIEAYSANSFKLSLIEKTLPADKWPVIWKASSIIALVNEVPEIEEEQLEEEK